MFPGTSQWTLTSCYKFLALRECLMTSHLEVLWMVKMIYCHWTRETIKMKAQTIVELKNETEATEEWHTTDILGKYAHYQNALTSILMRWGKKLIYMERSSSSLHASIKLWFLWIINNSVFTSILLFLYLLSYFLIMGICDLEVSSFFSSLNS